MPAQNRTTLKSYFNNGDLITEANLADLIDSCHNLTDDFPVRLPTTSFANVSTVMSANTRYAGSISGFTGSRTYSVPAGAAGDVIELQLTVGNATHALIISGDAGVSINGGTAGGEWSRLFIDNEFVRLRCHATNDWRVEVDGRRPAIAEMRLASQVNNVFPDSSYTRVPFDTITSDPWGLASTTTDQFTVRRAGTYLAEIDVLIVNLPTTALQYFLLTVFTSSRNFVLDEQLTPFATQKLFRANREFALSTGGVIYFEAYQAAASSPGSRHAGTLTRARLREVL